MIKIYIGDVTDELQQFAQKNYKDAKLITSDNCQNLAPGVYYLSLGDVNGLDEFVNTLEQADELIYAPPLHWSDTKDSYSYMQYWTEFYLYYFYNKKIVIFPTSKSADFMLLLADSRKNEKAQLWIVGCSVSNGDCVGKNQRYGQLIADRLKLDVSFLTASGSSIEWAADQILRSDIKKGDIVIWGITGLNRLPYYIDDTVQHINSNYYQEHPEFNSTLDIFVLDDTSNMIYKSVTKIHQVINFCNKLNVNLYLGGILVGPELAPFVAKLPNYIQFYGVPPLTKNKKFLDVGKDNRHPGPLTHQWYADTFLNKILNA